MFGIRMWLRNVFTTSGMHHGCVRQVMLCMHLFHHWITPPMIALHAEHPSPYVHVENFECITYVESDPNLAAYLPTDLRFLLTDLLQLLSFLPN